MLASPLRLFSSAIAASITLLSLTSCASPTPPIVSADTYCIKASKITATKDQADEMLGNEAKWRSFVLQVANHNTIYAASNCVDPTPAPGK